MNRFCCAGTCQALFMCREPYVEVACFTNVRTQTIVCHRSRRYSSMPHSASPHCCSTRLAPGSYRGDMYRVTEGRNSNDSIRSEVLMECSRLLTIVRGSITVLSTRLSPIFLNKGSHGPPSHAQHRCALYVLCPGTGIPRGVLENQYDRLLPQEVSCGRALQHGAPSCHVNELSWNVCGLTIYIVRKLVECAAGREPPVFVIFAVNPASEMFHTTAQHTVATTATTHGAAVLFHSQAGTI